MLFLAPHVLIGKWFWACANDTCGWTLLSFLSILNSILAFNEREEVKKKSFEPWLYHHYYFLFFNS